MVALAARMSTTAQRTVLLAGTAAVCFSRKAALRRRRRRDCRALDAPGRGLLRLLARELEVGRLGIVGIEAQTETIGLARSLADLVLGRESEHRAFDRRRTSVGTLARLEGGLARASNRR